MFWTRTTYLWWTCKVTTSSTDNHRAFSLYVPFRSEFIWNRLCHNNRLHWEKKKVIISIISKKNMCKKFSNTRKYAQNKQTPKKLCKASQSEYNTPDWESVFQFYEKCASDGQRKDCGWSVGVPSETSLLWPEFKVILREKIF